MPMRLRQLRGKAAEKRGRRGELFAVLLLVCKGYRILGRRVKTRAGEIDLIAQTLSGLICFIEVKARPDESLASEAVSLRQRARIVRAAGLYLAGKPRRYRFDRVSVLPGRLPRHIRGAWRAEDVL
ncbi:MAG: YraN family protein [Rhizomicrobium sp.]|nr:YraN family protein [Rhizomicrobium sp.]